MKTKKTDAPDGVGIKKADSNADDFCLEIKISKNSLSRTPVLPTASGQKSALLRAMEVSDDTSPLGIISAKVDDNNHIIKIFEENLGGTSFGRVK